MGHDMYMYMYYSGNGRTMVLMYKAHLSHLSHLSELKGGSDR